MNDTKMVQDCGTMTKSILLIRKLTVSVLELSDSQLTHGKCQKTVVSKVLCFKLLNNGFFYVPCIYTILSMIFHGDIKGLMQQLKCSTSLINYYS
jgi:hypothetical protein